MAEPEYALTWPRNLFDWEAKRVLDLADNVEADAVRLLLREAYRDPEVEVAYARTTGADAGEWADDVAPAVRDWLRALLNDEFRLQSYKPPKYWAERNGRVTKGSLVTPDLFDTAVIRAIDALQVNGYFPRLLPEPCVDEGPDYAGATQEIREATHLDVSWPVEDPEVAWMTDDVVYTLIEFFHDHAQRPRTSYYHSWNDCGFHYVNHDREAGGVIYRWRMNELLTRYGKPLRLSSRRAERGRLVKHFGLGLDTVADRIVAADEDQPVNEVAEAVRNYRERGASLAQKRSALNALAGALEPRRQAIKKVVMSKDETHLFDIANNYAIRHRNDHQRTDVGEEYLDWVYWNFVMMIDLMNRLEARSAA